MKRALYGTILALLMMVFGSCAISFAQLKPDVDCKPTDHCFPGDGFPGHTNPVPPIPQPSPPPLPPIVKPVPGPVTGPVETLPACLWSKENNGAFGCKADATVHVDNVTAFSCSMLIQSSTVRFERFSFSVEPKKPDGDRFAMYSIKTSVSTPGAPTFIAVDAQNEAKGPHGPLPITGDYVCHIEMTIWFP